MSGPDNQTTGRYLLRSGKTLISTPTGSGFSGLLPSSLNLPTDSPFAVLAPPADALPTTSSPPVPTPLADAFPSTSAPQVLTPPADAFLSTSPAFVLSPQSSNAVIDSDDGSDADSISSDSEMAGNTLVPSPFTGNQQEDILEFLKNFELWSTFRRMSGAQKLAALPLLLKNGAAVWFNTQSQATRESFIALRDALTLRYGPKATDAWKRAADLWSLKQLPHQSVDDFLTSVQQAAQKLDVDAGQTFLVALNGLRSNIRQHVLQHDLTTIEGLRKWGRLTELSQEDQSDTDHHIRHTVSELAAIREELKQLQITSVAAINSTRRRTPSPHHVTFVDQSPKPVLEPRLEPYATSTSRGYPPSAQSYPGHSENNRPHDSPSWRPRPPYRSQPLNSWRTTSKPTCGNCGGIHTSNNFCRARGVTCFRCSKRGHLQSVCRSTRGRYSQT